MITRFHTHYWDKWTLSDNNPAGATRPQHKSDMEKIIGRNKNWTFFQPNPQDKTNRKGDCHIRAIAGALNCSWLHAYDLMYEMGRKRFDSMSADNIGCLLEEHGFKPCKVSPHDKPTVDEFVTAHPTGTFVLRLAMHVVCVKDGQFYDTWDCGYKSVYRYWELK